VVFLVHYILEMKTYFDLIIELNSTAILAYGPGPEDDGFGFAADRVATDFDVEDYPVGDDKKPWEIQNAVGANKRRAEVKKFLKAAGAKSKKAFDNKSLEPIPVWQSYIR
jgi:hypothetical protein